MAQTPVVKTPRSKRKGVIVFTCSVLFLCILFYLLCFNVLAIQQDRHLPELSSKRQSLESPKVICIDESPTPIPEVLLLNRFLLDFFFCILFYLICFTVVFCFVTRLI